MLIRSLKPSRSCPTKASIQEVIKLAQSETHQKPCFNDIQDIYKALDPERFDITSHKGYTFMSRHFKGMWISTKAYLSMRRKYIELAKETQAYLSCSKNSKQSLLGKKCEKILKHVQN